MERGEGGVLALPDPMSFETGSLIEPLACCRRAAKKCRIGEGESVLVVGAGPVGMMHSLLLGSAGAEVLVSDISPWRLAFAERLGARVIDASKGDVPAAVLRETDGRGADIAMVASGSKGAIVQGLRSVRKGGRVCLFGVPARGSVLDYDVSEFYNAEREVLTSYGATETDTKEALKVLSSNGKRLGSLVTHRFPLRSFEQAVEAATSGDAMKVLVTG